MEEVVYDCHRSKGFAKATNRNEWRSAGGCKEICETQSCWCRRISNCIWVDFSYVFSYLHSFNEDVSLWDVSNATTMNCMFYWARTFNQDISSWDISNVETIDHMFYFAQSFNQDISDWILTWITCLKVQQPLNSIFLLGIHQERKNRKFTKEITRKHWTYKRR